MYLTDKQKLVIGGAIVFAVLFVVGSYFGGHWYYGDIEPGPEHLLTIEPPPPKADQQTSASSSQGAESLEGGSVSEVAELSGGDVVSTPPLDVTDDELDALLQELDASPDEKGDFPEVPDGFPADLMPVWIEFPNYQKGDMYDHEMMYRVLIKLWNQGDHDFVNGVYNDNGRVYPLYRDVVYVEWEDSVINGPDGEIKFPVIRSTLGTHFRGDPEENIVGGLFTLEEMITGDYKTKYPDLKLVDYADAGYVPETFLNDDKK